MRIYYRPRHCCTVRLQFVPGNLAHPGYGRIGRNPTECPKSMQACRWISMVQRTADTSAEPSGDPIWTGARDGRATALPSLAGM